MTWCQQNQQSAKTVKKPKGHHVGPRIRGSSITTDPLSQNRMNLVTDGHDAKTSLNSRVVKYISGNQVTFSAPEERKDKSILSLDATQSGIEIRDAMYHTLEH